MSQETTTPHVLGGIAVALRDANAACLVCAQPRTSGALCAPCRARVAGGRAILPQQIVTAGCPSAANACLIDRYGRPHPMASGATIGREDSDLVIACASVSRAHAALQIRDTRWWLSDLQSRNGVYLNSRRLTHAEPIAHGDLLARISHQNSSETKET